MKSKTPLTDEVAVNFLYDKEDYIKFARKLERKLIKSNKERLLLLNAAAKFVMFDACSCDSFIPGGVKIRCSWCIFYCLVDKINKNKGKKGKK